MGRGGRERVGEDDYGGKGRLDCSVKEGLRFGVGREVGEVYVPVLLPFSREAPKSARSSSRRVYASSVDIVSAVLDPYVLLEG